MAAKIFIRTALPLLLCLTANAATEQTAAMTAAARTNLGESLRDDRFLDERNTLNRFPVLGPFLPSSGHGDWQRESLHYQYIDKEKTLAFGRRPDHYAEWRLAGPSEGNPLNTDLNAAFPKNYVAYAVKTLWCDREYRHVSLHAGSTGYLKIWLNGRLIHSYDRQPRRGAPDQDRVDNLVLKKGGNRLVIKSVRTERPGEPWDFYCRFSHYNRPMNGDEPGEEEEKTP